MARERNQEFRFRAFSLDCRRNCCTSTVVLDEGMVIGVFWSGSRAVEDIARRMAHALGGVGHDVRVDRLAGYSLSPYQFLVFVTEPASLLGKLDGSFIEAITKSSDTIGKRCMALVRAGRPGSSRALRSMMAAIEHEGMVVVDSGLVRTAEEAERLALAAPLQRG